MGPESHMVGVRDMLREAEESIEALRKYKESREKAEWENNPLAPLAEEIARDSFIAELQPGKMEQMYENNTEFSKELSFKPADYNCGKDFDIFKLMDQVMASRRSTTVAPKCIEDFINGVTVCASSGTAAGSTEGAVSQAMLASSKPPTPSPDKQKSMKKGDTGKKIPEALAKVNNTPTGKTQKLPDHQPNKSAQSGVTNIKEGNKVMQQAKANAPAAQPKAIAPSAHQTPLPSHNVIGAENKPKPLQAVSIPKQPLAPLELGEEDSQAMPEADSENNLKQNSDYEDMDTGIQSESHDALNEPKLHDGSECNDILPPVEYVYEK